MDPFTDDRPELTGSLITIEFGLGGRISQLWASDPALPDEGEEFQFVLPPLAFGEENSEDYNPGTILIGARTNPDEPWILSRNGAGAQQIFDFDEAEGIDPGRVSFEYELPLLPDIQAIGRYFEAPGPIPQIVWELELRNRGRVSLEIGELGFPLALNNFYDGFGWSDEQLRRLWNSRLYLHPFVGGAASWMFAQRMTAEPPGLLIFPGEGTSWEFYNHVPASLATPHQWEGIPIVYAHSRASVEREGWPTWWNDHSSIILEPGDLRTYQMRFVPADRDKQDGVHQALLQCGRPAMRVLPAAVAPRDVGIAIEVSGVIPKRFYVSRQAQVEIDTDEQGGFCFVRPSEPGPLRVSFEDGEGRLSHVHLMFTDPIADLIQRRADYVTKNQVAIGPESGMAGAILLTDIQENRPVLDRDEYTGSAGLESSLADALFLARKNVIYPVAEQIAAVDEYLDRFLLELVQNPGDMSVGSVLSEASGIGTHVGRPPTYPHVFNLYHAMYLIARTYGARRSPRDYLELSARTAIAMFRYGWRHYVRTVGVLGYARLYDILDDLRREGLDDLVRELQPLMLTKARQLVAQQYPFAGESILDTSGFEDVHAAGMWLEADDHVERTIRCAFAAKSLAPSWWWYGSDKRAWDGSDSAPRRALLDRGEVCLGPTTIPNALMFFAALDRDYLAVPEAHMRLAFGGMLGPWTLIRYDGAAGMCYCPDLSSKHFGENGFTGSSGLGYAHYLIGAGAYVLPHPELGAFAFGCAYEADEQKYTVRPWDGVGRRVVLRQIDAEVEVTFGRIVALRLDLKKRWLELELENPADKAIVSVISVTGMWGRRLELNGQRTDIRNGLAEFTVELAPGVVHRLSMNVVA